MPKELDSIVQFTYCIKCGLCSSSCPTSSTDALFPGPQALAQAYRFLEDVRDEAGDKRLDLVDDAARGLEVPLRGDVLRGLPQGGRSGAWHPAPEEARDVREVAIRSEKVRRRAGAKVSPEPEQGPAWKSLDA